MPGWYLDEATNASFPIEQSSEAIDAIYWQHHQKSKERGQVSILYTPLQSILVTVL
jgi:hypothetical protein